MRVSLGQSAEIKNENLRDWKARSLFRFNYIKFETYLFFYSL